MSLNRETRNLLSRSRSQLDAYQRAVHRRLETTPARDRIIAVAVLYSVAVYCFGLYVDTIYGYPYTFDSVSVMLPIGLILAIVPALWMPTSFDRSSALLYWGLYALAYTPSVILAGINHGIVILPHLIVIAVTMGLIGVPYYLPLVSIPRVRLSPRHFWGGLLTLGGIFLAVIQATIGLPYGPDMTVGIYSVRHVYKADLAALPPLQHRVTVYAADWLYQVISPLFFTVGFLQRDWRKAGIGIFGFLTIFLLTGFKTTLFVPISIVGLWVVLQRARLFAIEYLLSGLLVGFAAVSVIHATVGVIAPLSFLRRLVVMPGVLTGLYIEFFTTHPVTLLSDRFFVAPFIEYPYDIPFPNLIGEAYFDRPEQSANANLWAEGFGSLGFAGFIIFALLAAVIFYAYDVVTKPVGSVVPTLLLVGFIITLSNGDPISFMVTNGFAFFLIVMWAYSCLERYYTPDRKALNRQRRFR